MARTRLRPTASGRIEPAEALAVGVTLAIIGVTGGLLLTGSVAALVYAYLIRFQAIALQTVESGLARITPSMEDAARSLGYTPAQALVRVHLPMMRGSLVTGALLVFVLSIGYYVTPQLLGGGTTVMIGQLIQRNIELFSSWGAASAVSMILLVMVTTIFVLMSRFLSLDRVFGAR